MALDDQLQYFTTCNSSPSFFFFLLSFFYFFFLFFLFFLFFFCQRRNKSCACHTALGKTKEAETKYFWPWNCLLASVARRQKMREEKAGICMKASFLEHSDIIQWSKEHFPLKRFGIKMVRNATVCEHKESFNYSLRNTGG